jgi:pyrimidine deaminase RibD-like protein
MTLSTRPEHDAYWLRVAIAASRDAPPSATAFSVGAVIVAAGGRALVTGYSRETSQLDHAEEIALRKVAEDAAVRRELATATLYSSLEPCSRRASRPRTCTELIVAAGIRRVVFAWREPAVFVDCVGAELLRAADVDVGESAELADEVREINAHLLTGHTARNSK